MAHIAALVELVIKDAHSLTSRYPHQLVFALTDQRVRQAVENRLDAGQVLTGIDTLPADRATGLIPIYLSFAAGSALKIDAGSLLVQLNHRCEVATVEEDFEPRLPNPVSKLPPRDALPAAVVKSENKRLTRRIDPQVLDRMNDLHDALIVKHGVLVQVDESGLDHGTGVILDTECAQEIPFTYDTEFLVVNTETGEIDSITLADEGSEIQYVVDDSESTTVGDLFDRFN